MVAMNTANCIICCLLAFVGLNASTSNAETIRGLASVVDGQSVRFQQSGLTVRLYGVEACKLDQRAFYQGVSWPCGVVAAGWLTKQTLGFPLTCLVEGDAGYAAYLGRCYLPDGSDIARGALRDGMVIALRDDSHIAVPEYAASEAEARSQHKGLWSSSFEIGGQLFRGHDGE
jgi:endonuclease YncB( thermonuclease family)